MRSVRSFRRSVGVRAGAGAGVEAVDLVDEDQAYPGGGVGVADGGGDLGLRHPGGDGDAEVAGELGGEGLGGRSRRHQDVRDRHGVPARVGAGASVCGEVAGAPDVQDGGGLAARGGPGDDQRGPGGGVLVTPQDHQGAHGVRDLVDGGGLHGDEPGVVGEFVLHTARRRARGGRRGHGCVDEPLEAVPGRAAVRPVLLLPALLTGSRPAARPRERDRRRLPARRPVGPARSGCTWPRDGLPGAARPGRHAVPGCARRRVARAAPHHCSASRRAL